MWVKISQFRTELTTQEELTPERVAGRLKLPLGSIKQLEINRKSLDARHKNLSFIYTLLIKVDLPDDTMKAFFADHPEALPYRPEPSVQLKSVHSVAIKRPVIVGAGPAGLFAGLRLAAAGFRPIIMERGDGLAARIESVTRFWETGELDPQSNMQFGSGGAGTFSDGKLTTRVKHPLIPVILQTMVELGAPTEILYWQYPHIGTDLLRHVVAGLEKRILEYGGEIHYRHTLTDFTIKSSRIHSLTFNGTADQEVDVVVLATGNSARDLYALCAKKGIRMVAKPLAVGLRIEHPQEIIDAAQYGQWAGHPKLGPAEYHLTYQHQPTGRGVYSFCMCPGGMVVGAASEPGGVVTNGMSFHARDSGVANAAIVVTVNPNDFGGQDPLAGVRWQQRLEQRAFLAGGGKYAAPVQRLQDFLKKQPSNDFSHLAPSYRPGYTPANLWEVLPVPLCGAIADGLKYFGSKIKNFDWPDAVLTAVETRTSAPLKILRAEDHQADGIEGLYPAGEGAGYAGGIISSALDGFKTAECIIAKYGE